MAKLNPLRFLLLLMMAALLPSPRAAGAETVTPAAKWQRLELTFKSSVTYANPLQDAEMRVLFVSPLGETNRVYGFWDGGKTWRVRFQPGFAGRWTYYTMCSDTANAGLHEQRGTFLCTASKTDSRFDQHGPIQVARSRQHLEHADRTPFLWLGDAAWSAGLNATSEDWSEFVQTRAEQKFNVVQWRLDAKTRDSKLELFPTGQPANVNLPVARQLDAKITTANRAGLLCAIAPLWEIGATPPELRSDEEAIQLLRYAVARWGADHVSWLVAFESDSSGKAAQRWQKIGRAVFQPVTHAPVVLCPGESIWVLDAFRQENWVDVLGFQTVNAANDATLPWLLRGPLRQERLKTPSFPLLTVVPPLETPTASDTPLIRQMLWWSLLLNTPAGVSCATRDIADWNTDQRNEQSAWRAALSTTGAKAIAPLSDSFANREYWRLKVLPLANATGNASGSTLPSITAASTADQNLSLFYAPGQSAIQLSDPPPQNRQQAVWVNPQSGERRPALSQPAAAGGVYRTPGPGDWVLIMTRTPEPARRMETKKAQPMIDKL